MSELKETSLLDAVEDADRKPRRIGSKRTEKPASATPKPSVSFNRKAVEKALTGLYDGAGMALMTFDPECAKVFMSPDFTANAVEAWLNLADTSPMIKRVLMRLTQTSGWGGVVAAHLPLIMAVASHHTDMGKHLANLAARKDDNGS